MSIEKIQQGDEFTQSKDLIQDNISKLKELFPEIITEDKIDFKVLRDILGDEIEEEEEYYRFTWGGKSAARREAHKPSTGTLRPIKEESVEWEKTQNLYIEGDNLESLKLLQKSYAGKIKMIYIDPPYNTGGDFVYKDDYKDNLKNYQKLTHQINSEGNKLATNTETDGRFHSNWLNMIYPRLILARGLLKHDGIIFISIDDNEFENLKKICNEIFGEDNFIANFIWEKRTNRENRKTVSTRHDYILCYAKSVSPAKRAIKQLPMNEKALANYKNPDNDPRGLWKSDPATAQAGHGTVNQFYELKSPNGKVHKLESGRCWVYTKPVMEEAIRDNRIWFGKDGNGVPRIKTFLDAKERGLTPETIFFAKDVATTEIAKNRLKELFNGIAVFETPKPVDLIKTLLQLATDSEDIICDFFAGSSTTAHAVLELNSEDQGNRRFIEIQLPESNGKNDAYRAGFQTISQIGRERIRKVGEKILNENPLFAGNFDLGFKYLTLDKSNIKGWGGKPGNLEQSLYDSVTNIIEGRTEEDVLYEILLKYGLDLALPIEKRTIEGKKVFNVGLGALFICLADNIKSKVAEGIGKWKEEINPEICRVIFKDTGFTDVEKTNSVQTLKRFGIVEVKSI